MVAIVGGVVAATSSSDNDLSSPLLPTDRSSISPTMLTPTVLAGRLYPDKLTKLETIEFCEQQ